MGNNKKQLTLFVNLEQDRDNPTNNLSRAGLKPHKSNISMHEQSSYKIPNNDNIWLPFPDNYNYNNYYNLVKKSRLHN